MVQDFSHLEYHQQNLSDFSSPDVQVDGYSCTGDVDPKRLGEGEWRGWISLLVVAIPCMGELSPRVPCIFRICIYLPYLFHSCLIYAAIFCIYTVTTLVGTWAPRIRLLLPELDMTGGEAQRVKHEDVMRMLPYIVKWMLSGVLCGYLRFNWIGRIDLWWKDYPPGNQDIPSQGTFEDDIPCPKVGYVSPLESVPENVCSCWQPQKRQGHSCI